MPDTVIVPTASAPSSLQPHSSSDSNGDSPPKQQTNSALAASSFYGSPSAARTAARHLRAQRNRRVQFAQHVKETIFDNSTPFGSAANSFGNGVANTSSNSNSAKRTIMASPPTSDTQAAQQGSTLSSSPTPLQNNDGVSDRRSKRGSTAAVARQGLLTALQQKLSALITGFGGGSQRGGRRGKRPLSTARLVLYALSLALAAFVGFKFVASRLGSNGARTAAATKVAARVATTRPKQMLKL